MVPLQILPIMRRYNTQKIGALLKKKRKEMGVLRLIEQYKELEALWNALPDPVLHKLKVTLRITPEQTLQIVCPSSVALTYTRQRRNVIQTSLKEFMDTHQLEFLEIILE